MTNNNENLHAKRFFRSPKRLDSPGRAAIHASSTSDRASYLVPSIAAPPVFSSDRLVGLRADRSERQLQCGAGFPRVCARNDWRCLQIGPIVFLVGGGS